MQLSRTCLHMLVYEENTRPQKRHFFLSSAGSSRIAADRSVRSKIGAHGVFRDRWSLRCAGYLNRLQQAPHVRSTMLYSYSENVHINARARLHSDGGAHALRRVLDCTQTRARLHSDTGRPCTWDAHALRRPCTQTPIHSDPYARDV
jgi:hypothetical protein